LSCRHPFQGISGQKTSGMATDIGQCAQIGCAHWRPTDLNFHSLNEPDWMRVFDARVPSILYPIVSVEESRPLPLSSAAGRKKLTNLRLIIDSSTVSCDLETRSLERLLPQCHGSTPNQTMHWQTRVISIVDTTKRLSRALLTQIGNVLRELSYPMLHCLNMLTTSRSYVDRTPRHRDGRLQEIEISIVNTYVI